MTSGAHSCHAVKKNDYYMSPHSSWEQNSGMASAIIGNDPCKCTTNDGPVILPVLSGTGDPFNGGWLVLDLVQPVFGSKQDYCGTL